MGGADCWLELASSACSVHSLLTVGKFHMSVVLQTMNAAKAWEQGYERFGSLVFSIRQSSICHLLALSPIYRILICWSVDMWKHTVVLLYTRHSIWFLYHITVMPSWVCASFWMSWACRAIGSSFWMGPLVTMLILALGCVPVYGPHTAACSTALF